MAYYLRTSAPGGGVPGGLTRTHLAVLRLADGTASGLAVRDALAVVDADGLDALRAELADPVLAWLVQLVGDGLYLRTLTGTPLPDGLGGGGPARLPAPRRPARRRVRVRRTTGLRPLDIWCVEGSDRRDQVLGSGYEQPSRSGTSPLLRQRRPAA